MRRIKPLKKILLGVSSFFLIFIAGTQKTSAAIVVAVPVLVKTGLWVVGGLLAWLGFGAGINQVAEHTVRFITNIRTELLYSSNKLEFLERDVRWN